MSADRRRQLTLFGGDDRQIGPAQQPDATYRLARALPSGVRLGTSSWSFPGWGDLVWDRESNERTLARHGLSAYARHPLFGAVGLDRTYYAPMTARALGDMAAMTPPGFRFVVKAAERATIDRFPDPNPHFLDATFAVDQVVGPVMDGLGDRAGPIVFQFPPRRIDEPGAFLDRLHRFLAALPMGPLYAVEIRTHALCTPAFGEAVRTAGAVPCLTVHPSMPTLRVQQSLLADALDGPLVVRWMLGHGRAYEDARTRYAPFDRLVDPDPASRRAVAALVVRAVRRRQPAFVTVNNKAEGSAPRSIEALATDIVALGASTDSSPGG